MLILSLLLLPPFKGVLVRCNIATMPMRASMTERRHA